MHVWIGHSHFKGCIIYIAWKDGVLIHTQAVMHFTQLADNNEDVPPLRNKKYSWFQLSKLEWDGLKLLHKVLKVSHHVHIFRANANLMIIGNRSQQQCNNHSQHLMSLLSGA